MKIVFLQTSDYNQQPGLCPVQGAWESLWDGAHHWASICLGFPHHKSQCPHVGEPKGMWAFGHHSWHPGPKSHCRLLGRHLFSSLPYRADGIHVLCLQPQFWPEQVCSPFLQCLWSSRWGQGSFEISGGITALVSKLWRRDGFCQAAQGDYCVLKWARAISCRKSLLQRNCIHQKPHDPAPSCRSAWLITRVQVSCTWGLVIITCLAEARQWASAWLLLLTEQRRL